MTVNRRTLAELLAQQKALDAIQDDQQRLLAIRWAKTWDRLESELRTRTLEIAQLGDDAGVDAIVRHIKASRALSDVTGQLTALLATSQAMSRSNAQAMIARAASDQQALIATQLPPGFTLSLMRHDPGQLEAIVKRTLDQITVRHYYLNQRATESMKQALVNAVAIGDNPTVAAERMVKAVQGQFEGGLARATVIARTEQLDAYRSAAQLEQNRHPDVMAGWAWTAQLSSRTCPSCLSMHGTIHDASEPGPIDHHQGRCARVPVTKTWEQLGSHGIPEPPGAIKPGDGIRWLEQQPGDVQLAIMGPKRWHAWRDGDYPPEDWTVRIEHWSNDEHGRRRQDWRDSLHVGPVRGDHPARSPLPPVEPSPDKFPTKPVTLAEAVKDTPQLSQAERDLQALASSDALDRLDDAALDALAFRRVEAGDFQGAQRAGELIDARQARKAIPGIDYDDDTQILNPAMYRWAAEHSDAEVLAFRDRITAISPALLDEFDMQQWAWAESKSVDRLRATQRPTVRQVRAEFDDYIDRELLDLENDTNGNIVATRWRGTVKPRDLYSMNWATARKYATEETLLYWQSHGGKMTWAAFKEMYLGDAAEAAVQRSKTALDW